MKLKLRRTQKSGMTGKITFTLNAKAELTPDELEAVKKYKLQKDVLFSQDRVDVSAVAANQTGVFRGIATLAAAKALNLTITIGGLIEGKSIDCKDIGEMMAAESRMQILDAIRSLPEGYELPMLMRYLEGLPYKDIATRLGVREDTLRKRVHRANMMLKDKLDKLIGDGD